MTLWPWPWHLTYFWKNLTLAITFKPEEIGLSYCTCVFLVKRPFTWYHNFWPRDLDLEVWPTCEKLLLCLLFNEGCRPASVVVFWQLYYQSFAGNLVQCKEEKRDYEEVRLCFSSGLENKLLLCNHWTEFDKTWQKASTLVISSHIYAPGIEFGGI